MKVTVDVTVAVGVLITGPVCGEIRTARSVVRFGTVSTKSPFAFVDNVCVPATTPL